MVGEWECAHSAEREGIPEYRIFDVYLLFRYSDFIGMPDITMKRISDPVLTSTQLGAILHAERKAKGLTQSALAARIGLSQSRVSHLEQNADELSVQQLLAWCAVLDLELSVRQPGAASMSSTSAEW